MAERATITTAERVTRVIVEHLGVDPEKVTPDAMLVDDLGADSLDAIEMAMAIAQDLDVDISDDDPIFRNFGTRVRDVIDFVERARG